MLLVSLYKNLGEDLGAWTTLITPWLWNWCGPWLLKLFSVVLLHVSCCVDLWQTLMYWKNMWRLPNDKTIDHPHKSALNSTWKTRIDDLHNWRVSWCEFDIVYSMLFFPFFLLGWHILILMSIIRSTHHSNTSVHLRQVTKSCMLIFKPHLPWFKISDCGVQ